MPTGVYERTEECKRIHREALNRPEVIKKQSRAQVKNWQDLEYRRTHIEAMSRARIRNWQNPEYRKNHVEAMNKARTRPEVIEKRKEAQIRAWQNPDIREKTIRAQMKASHFSPNGAESKLNELLQQICPHDYKYVGDGDFILAGKCPDFVNVNGQKKIIELYGNYWHRGETGEERIALFKQYGYDTLIVWEDELKDEGTLKEKLLNFNEEKP